MREILFRGKRIDNGQWVYGNLVEWLNETKDVSIIAHPFGCCIDEVGNLVLIEEPFVCKVHPETIGQYTGMTDKKGNKIFEGDIIKITGSYNETDGTYTFYEETGIVGMHNGCFCIKRMNEHETSWEPISDLIDEELEIIGNIHDTGGDSI